MQEAVKHAATGTQGGRVVFGAGTYDVRRLP